MSARSTGTRPWPCRRRPRQPPRPPGLFRALGQRAELTERDFPVGEDDHAVFALELGIIGHRVRGSEEVRPTRGPAVGVGSVVRPVNSIRLFQKMVSSSLSAMGRPARVRGLGFADGAVPVDGSLPAGCWRTSGSELPRPGADAEEAAGHGRRVGSAGFAPSDSPAGSSALSARRARSVHWVSTPGPSPQTLSCSWSSRMVSPRIVLSPLVTRAQGKGPGRGG